LQRGSGEAVLLPYAQSAWGGTVAGGRPPWAVPIGLREGRDGRGPGSLVARCSRALPRIGVQAGRRAAGRWWLERGGRRQWSAVIRL